MARANQLVMSIIWIILLVVLVWPLALAAAFLFVLLQPFEACFGCMGSVTKFLEKLVTWPRDFGYAIARGTETCPTP